MISWRGELQKKIEGIRHQIELLSDKRNTILQVNRAARTAMDVFRDILEKDHLERNDLELIVDRIRVFEDHLEIQLKADVEAILQSTIQEDAVNFKSGIENIPSCRIVQQASRRKDKVFDVHVISDGDG